MSTIATFTLTWICRSVSLAGFARALNLCNVAVPDDYDWGSTRAIAQADAGNTPSDATDIIRSSEIVRSSPSSSVKAGSPDEKDDDARVRVSATQDDEIETEPELDREELQRVFVKAGWISGTLALIITIVRAQRRYRFPWLIPASPYRSFHSRSSSRVMCTRRSSSPPGSPFPLFGSYAPAFCACEYSAVRNETLTNACVRSLLPIWESRTQIKLIIVGLTGIRKVEMGKEVA